MSNIDGFHRSHRKTLTRRNALLAIPLLLGAYFVPGCSKTTSLTAAIPKMTYPPTKRLDVVEQHFGQTITDPYRWLENDVRTDKEVAAWIESQNKVTNSYLATLPARVVFKERLKQLFNYQRFTIPVKKGSRYFYFRNSGVDNQRILYVRDSVDGAGRMLIDPNTWTKDGTTALAEWSASDDGTQTTSSPTTSST